MVLQDSVGGDRLGSGKTGGETRIQAARRHQLIDAAVAVIAEHGLSQLTLAKVAGRAGLTAAMVNFHFRNKSELLLATLRALSREFQDSVESAITAAPDAPRARLEAFIEASFDPALCDPRKVAVWYAFLAESQARAEYQQACGEMDLAYDLLVRELFEAVGAEAGVWLDSEVLAQGLIGLIEGQWQTLLAAPAGFDRAAARDLCCRFLGSVLPDRGSGADRPVTPRLDAEAPTAASQRWTLPSWCYNDAALFEAERSRLHLPAWQLVCHVSQVPEPGDAMTLDYLGQRLFVVRGADGRVRSFHNVCRHRAHAVVPEGASRCPGLIRCPYHGWVYGLDGGLQAVAARSAFPAIDEARLGLLPVESEVHLGLVFVRAQPGGSPGRQAVAERLAPWDVELAAYRIPEMRSLAAPWSREIPADWKTVWDNFLEGYHFAAGHPGLDALMDRDYREEVCGPKRAARLWHALRERRPEGWAAGAYWDLAARFDHLPESLARSWRYLFLFPSLALDLYPDMIDVFQVLPVGPGRCRLRGLSFALPDARREMRAARWLNRRINRQVQREDEALIASVQRGLESRASPQGPLAGREQVVAAFQEWVAEALPQVRQERAPDARSV